VLQSYRKADAFLFPSRSDVFGLVLVEALGSGLPTISATAPGGVPDLCVAGHNCLLVDGHDAPRWAEQIDRLARDEALRRLLGSNGRRTILCRWTIEHAIDAFIAGLRLGLARSSQIG
jgi:glycosyltransferase involved in cell wall biosynthesis